MSSYSFKAHSRISYIERRVFISRKFLEDSRKYIEYKKVESAKSRSASSGLEFHVTANQVVQPAKRAWSKFEISEFEEKRQLLKFVFQHLKSQGENLLLTLSEPFHLFI